MTSRHLIDTAVLEEYARSGKKIVPAFPWVLVRTILREQQVGMIVTPERQNKPVIEGVVVEVWQYAPERFYNVNASKWEKPALYESDLVPGDHVLFPHSAGMPCWGYDPGEYRFVKECNWEKGNEGGIVGVIREGIDARDELFRMLQHSNTASGGEMIERILDRYILIDKNKRSRTLSGV